MFILQTWNRLAQKLENKENSSRFGIFGQGITPKIEIKSKKPRNKKNSLMQFIQKIKFYEFSQQALINKQLFC
jgi:hypothetical protein